MFEDEDELTVVVYKIKYPQLSAGREKAAAQIRSSPSDCTFHCNNSTNCN